MNREALADWDDPQVQMVYHMLCDMDQAPPKSEHWEGWLARRIIAALRAPEPVPQGYKLVPQLKAGNSPEKQAAFDAFYAACKHELPHNADGTHSGTFWCALMCGINAYLLVAAPNARRDWPSAMATAMNPDTQLVARLVAASSKPSRNELGIGDYWNLCDEAATALEAAQARIEQATELLRFIANSPDEDNEWDGADRYRELRKMAAEFLSSHSKPQERG